MVHYVLEAQSHGVKVGSYVKTKDMLKVKCPRVGKPVREKQGKFVKEDAVPCLVELNS